jgi:quinol monooxygenase YgiN
MAVLIRHRVAGMTASQYDEVSPPLIEKLKTAPGFMYHVAFVDKGTFTVSEIWESQEQHDRWFDENVAPTSQALSKRSSRFTPSTSRKAANGLSAERLRGRGANRRAVREELPAWTVSRTPGTASTSLRLDASMTVK